MSSCEWISRKFRVPLLMMAFAAITVGVVRCSPISPSMSKLRRLAPSSPSSPALDEATSGLPSLSGSGISALTPSQTPAPRPGMPARVLDFAAYDEETSALPAAQRMTLSTDEHSEEFDSFKEKRAVLVHFGGTTPDSCRGYLGLAISPTLLQARNLDPIYTECTPVSENTWSFSVSSSVPDADWQWITSTLQSVTIFVSNDPRMSIQAVDAQTAPQPAPSESAPSNGSSAN